MHELSVRLKPQHINRLQDLKKWSGMSKQQILESLINQAWTNARKTIMEEEMSARTLEEKWVTSSVYCNLCGHEWQAVYDDVHCTRLECPNCGGMSRLNIISSQQES